MKEVELSLTNKCQWHCDYCVADIHNQPLRPYEDVLGEAKEISPCTEVTFSGGEPGLLKKEQIMELIGILKSKGCPIDLLTNGLFIKRFPDLLKHFGKVHYHCIEYIGDDIEFPDRDDVIYCVVVEDKNLLDGSLIKMINRYHHIKFLTLFDVRNQHKINLNNMTKFVNEYKDKIHPTALDEFITVVSRWH